MSPGAGPAAADGRTPTSTARTADAGCLDYAHRVSAPAPSLDRIVALVPVRGLEDAKARLGEVLDPEERRALVARLLAQTVGAARATAGIVQVAVVSADPTVFELARTLGAAVVAQGAGGLNEGLLAGREWAEKARADALLVLPMDLPAVGPGELARIIEAGRTLVATELAGGRRSRALVALVADRAGTGTNVLLLAPPAAIPPRFGDDSRTAHATAARAAGAAYLELDGPLTLDIDTPDDLLAAEHLGLVGLRTGLP